MRVHRDLNELPDFSNAVITIGSFDGVHQGHQSIIEQVKQIASQQKGESVVITFHPHPRSIVFPKDTSLRLITTTEEKIHLFERYQVDHLVVVPFTVEFSQMLIGRNLHVKHPQLFYLRRRIMYYPSG